MPLRLERLWLKDFRSYDVLEITLDSNVTIIVGPNAVGKTNIIEAVQLLTSASSFRNPPWAECVRWGAESASLSLTAAGDGREIETTLRISAQGKRGYSINGTAKKRVSDVTGIMPSVVFTPDDLRMVKDSADKRRSAIDAVGDQLSATYLSLRSEYERIVKQRNALLKNPDPPRELMDTLTERLISRGGVFSGHRKRLFSRLSSKVRETYHHLSPGEELEALYQSSWTRRGMEEDGQNAYAEALRASKQEETARGMTLVGPHRDEVLFLIDGRDARAYASQGQQRTVALAWKLAEVSVITDVSSQPPILLLDDVMSELDEERRHALTAMVGEKAQALVTTTNINYFEPDAVSRASVVRLG